VDLLYVAADNALELDALRNDTSGEVAGTCAAGSTTTSVVAASLLPPPVALDEYAARTLVFDDATLTAALRGRHSAISAQTIAGVLTVAALVVAPARGELFKVIDYLNAATVAVTLKDAAGVEVTGETWPFTLAYVTGTKGRYRAILTDALVLVAGQIYTATITVVSGTLNRTFERAFPAVKS
jgi:hypothetical protein